MREDRAPKPRPPRMLVPVNTPVLDAFDLADREIIVDGETIRLGDYWPMARYLAETSLILDLTARGGDA